MTTILATHLPGKQYISLDLYDGNVNWTKELHMQQRGLRKISWVVAKDKG